MEQGETAAAKRGNKVCGRKKQAERGAERGMATEKASCGPKTKFTKARKYVKMNGRWETGADRMPVMNNCLMRL